MFRTNPFIYTKICNSSNFRFKLVQRLEFYSRFRIVEEMTLNKSTGPEKQPTSLKIVEKPVGNPRILRREVMK